MTPSPQQSRIYDFVENDVRSLIVNAAAGSGKTTTLVELAKRIPNTKSCVFLAFNKKIAVALQERLPKHITASTFHSHCFKPLGRSFPTRPRVDAEKIYKLCKDSWQYEDFDKYYKFVSKLVGYAKNAGIGTDLMSNIPANWFDLVAYNNMILDKGGTEEQGVAMAQAILEKSNADNRTIDFDDMLYLSLKFNVHFDKHQFVMLDEAQDTNAVQRALLKKMFGPGGRLIAVGDPAQSIYGFRGADADAMDRLKTEFSCQELPLSVSYRCAQNVVKEAQKTVPTIQYHEGAPLGSVDRLHSYDPTVFTPDDAILCRVTAPLVSLAFGFIRRYVGVRILGREIGTGLVSLVKKLSTGSDIDLLQQKLGVWRLRETDKALARGQESAAAAIEDKADCLNVFIEQLKEDERTTQGLIRQIEALFTDNNKGLLTLCSVHKAKGLEWENVFILDKHKYMPSKYASQDWQIVQEHNLIYVAVTRAKLNLRYIESGAWKAPQRELAPPITKGEALIQAIRAPETETPLTREQRRKQLLADL